MQVLLDQVTMYYPMRVLRTPEYRLIHNLNFPAPYPIAGDIFGSPTFHDILNRTDSGQDLKWFKSLRQYYYREQFELFDLNVDPQELDNLASDPAHQKLFQSLMEELLAWQRVTDDPWLCAPSGVLMGGTCQSMDNGP
nr:hypothetical protein BaRGS_005637 [Batillaria attramentaria]